MNAKLRIPKAAGDVAEAVESLALDKIDPNPSNPRSNWDAQQLEALAPSVRQTVIHPIIVRPMGQRFQIVDGERRYRAAALAKLTHIPAIVRRLSDAEALRKCWSATCSGRVSTPSKKRG